MEKYYPTSYTFDANDTNGKSILTMTGFETEGVSVKKLFAVFNATRNGYLYKITDQSISTCEVVDTYKFKFTPGTLSITGWEDTDELLVVYNDPRRNLGKSDDAAVVGDVSGSVFAKLRGIGKILNDVWDTTNSRLKVTTAPLLNTIDVVTATDDSRGIIVNGVFCPFKFVKISASSSGNNNLVAAVTAKKIRVLQYSFTTAGAVNTKFQSDGAGTPVDLTGLRTYGAAGLGPTCDYSKSGWFESASGKTLDINLSGAVLVGGELVYIEV